MTGQPVDWRPYLEEGENLVAERRLHVSMMLLPAFVLLVGLWQFTPWRIAYASAGIACTAFGLFTGWLFWHTLRTHAVALTDRRFLYLNKAPGRAPQAESWELSRMTNYMLRKGVLGGPLHYGHLILLGPGGVRMAVVRSLDHPEGICERLKQLLDSRR